METLKENVTLYKHKPSRHFEHLGHRWHVELQSRTTAGIVIRIRVTGSGDWQQANFGPDYTFHYQKTLVGEMLRELGKEAVEKLHPACEPSGAYQAGMNQG